MGLFGKKRRRYPIKRDDYGKSARTRCFEMFEDGLPLPEIARRAGVSKPTVYTYHSQWKKHPHMDVQLSYLNGLLRRENPERERTIELLARTLGISKEDLETALSKPYGLRSLLTWKTRFPAHEEQDYRWHMALQLASLFTDHLVKQGGNFEDIYNALARFMKGNKRLREEEDQDIKAHNERLASMRRIIQAAVETERRERVAPDRLTPEEVQTVMEWELDKEKKKVEIDYWLRIARFKGQGLTEEQAREKLVRELIRKGDLIGAEKLRDYQNTVHPIRKQPEELPSEASGKDKETKEP